MLPVANAVIAAGIVIRAVSARTTTHVIVSTPDTLEKRIEEIDDLMNDQFTAEAKSSYAQLILDQEAQDARLLVIQRKMATIQEQDWKSVLDSKRTTCLKTGVTYNVKDSGGLKCMYAKDTSFDTIISHKNECTDVNSKFQILSAE